MWWIRPCSRFAYSRKPRSQRKSKSNINVKPMRDPRVARNRQSYYYKRNTKWTQGLWEKSTRAEESVSSGKE